MSIASAFGISGYDPLGSWISNELEGHYMRKNSAYAAALNYEYALKGARELPSAQIEGLKAAGINPAVGYLKGLSTPVYSAPSNMTSAPMSGNTAASAAMGVGGIFGAIMSLIEKREDLESKRLENSAKAVEVQARINKAYLNAERDQFRRDRHYMYRANDIKDGNGKNWGMRVLDNDVVRQIQEADSKEFENIIDGNLLKWIETLSNSASDLMSVNKLINALKPRKGGITIKNSNRIGK